MPPAHDPFVVTRADGTPTIIAGYPWFTDWGRDTMIACPACSSPPASFDEARDVIAGLPRTTSNKGLIPNRFPDAGETPEYNTVDATLWFFQAVRAYLAASGDRRSSATCSIPPAEEIVDWHRDGTRYGIGVDPADGLLIARRRAGTQLTWMDAKVGDWVVTPRHGKAGRDQRALVQRAALMADGRRSQATPHRPNVTARKPTPRAPASAKNSGTRMRGCLYDVLDATEPAPSPNCAQTRSSPVSLPHPLLERAAESRSEIVERELLTPVGLRTLERTDPDYKPRYEGDPRDRDAAYHQGTVWPWLIGPFIDAYLNAFGQTPQTLAYCKRVLDTLEAEDSKAGCLGSIAEIYDAGAPRHPRGCPAQAWSVAEVARVRFKYGW